MTVLSASKQRPVRIPPLGLKTRSAPLAGYTNFGAGNLAHSVFKGGVVICDVSNTDGYFRACPLSSAVNLTSSDIFGGIAAHKQDVTSDNLADGAAAVTVFVNGEWGFAKGSIAQTDIGAPAYASDDDTVTTVSTNNIWIGYFVGVDADFAWVDIEKAAGRTNSPT